LEGKHTPRKEKGTFLLGGSLFWAESGENAFWFALGGKWQGGFSEEDGENVRLEETGGSEKDVLTPDVLGRSLGSRWQNWVRMKKKGKRLFEWGDLFEAWRVL